MNCKKALSSWLLALGILACGLVVYLSGCGSSHPAVDTSTSTGTVATPVTPAGLSADQKATIIAKITTVGADAVDLGLTEWSKSNNALATQVATDLHKNIQGLLPLLNGQAVQPSTVIQNIVASDLYVNIPPLVKIAIEGGSMVLDQFVTIPSAGEGDKIDFIRAFVTAIDSGCQEYLATPPGIGKSMRAGHGLVK